jgi:phosphoribosylformimino-5-aminoimidazole carboxamide ribotide isomerase
MMLIPAIDLRGGRAVRLVKGEADKECAYDRAPTEFAAEFVGAGARYLHVIDLGAAFGEAPSTEDVRAIIARAGVPVQVGGGIRSLERVRELLDMGADRLIVGTKALGDPAFLEAAVRVGGAERIMVSIDIKDGKVGVDGWRTTTDFDGAALGARFRTHGIARVLVTAIERDGTFLGPNIDLWLDVARATGMRVIGAGGIGSLRDLARVRDARSRALEGVVAGRALLEGRIPLREALAIFAAPVCGLNAPA